MLKNHKKLSEGEKWRMKKVYIWGPGKYGRKVLPAVRTEYCSIEGFIDNDPSKYGKVYSGIEIVPFREIMDVARNEWKKTWKVQTLNTYLINLQKVGLIGTDRTLTQYNAYFALCTKEEHIHNWTRKLVETCFDNSFSRFALAFVGNGKLSKEDAEELKKLL